MLIERMLERAGGHATVTVGAETVALEELWSAAGAVAHEVYHEGGPAVAVDATPTRHTVTAVLGGLAAGVPVVPLPPDGGAAEFAHMVADSGAVAVFTERPDHFAGLGITVPCRRAPARSTRPLYSAPVDPAATAMVLYTSGTTGKPKGVALSQAAIEADLAALYRRWEITAEDTVAHGLPLYHVHGLILGVLGPLWAGAGLIHTGRPTPDAYAGARAAGATTYFAVPTVWSRMCQAPDRAEALQGARLLVSGSAALPPTVFGALEALTGCPVLERYGMTETMITISTALDRPRLPGTVGWPIDGVSTRLVDDAGAPMTAGAEPGAGPGEPGDLQVRTPSMFNGYLNLEAVTAESFTDDGWFRTGDVATIDGDGAHRIVGRASVDLIKSGGFRIGAGEIEDCLLAHAAVRDCAVIGVPDDDLGQRIEAYVIGAGASEGELVEHVATTLSVHKRPRRIHFVDDLPRNHMGKVVKQDLLAEHGR